VRSRKRVARGNSAGGGTTAGRGTKGQQARTGKGRRFGFEGGQTPLLRRQPKLGGFEHPKREDFEVVHLSDLERTLDPGTYGIDDLRKLSLVRTRRPVKILSADAKAQSALTKALHLSVHAASKSARESIEKAGGSVTLLKR
jgi:large subunit ribosomal protein L15